MMEISQIIHHQLEQTKSVEEKEEDDEVMENNSANSTGDENKDSTNGIVTKTDDAIVPSDSQPHENGNIVHHLLYLVTILSKSWMNNQILKWKISR